MEKADFEVAEAGAWWLVTPDYSIIEERRKQLGAAIGKSELQWYLQLDNLQELYRQLEPNYSLMQQLDNANNDDKRLEWLAAMTKVLQPEEEEESESEEKPPQDVVSPPLNGDAANPVTDASAAPKQEAPSPFPKKSSPFASKEDVSPADANTGGAPPVPADLQAIAKEVATDFGNSSELASELGVSEDELKDILDDLPADFESRVAAEAARLAAEA
jgi:hypothetical protein